MAEPAMQPYADMKQAVEAAVEPLFRKLRPTPAEPPATRKDKGPPPPRGVGPDAWSSRASPVPLPHVWPPDGALLLDLPVFAYCISGHIADGERQAAPFARAIVSAQSGEIVRVEPLGFALVELGVQGVQPAPGNLWARIETGVLRLREAVAAEALPDAAASLDIREGYCAFLGHNGLLAVELERLQPSFARWLRRSVQAPLLP